MKIYGQDHGYRGVVFVIANSQEEAVEMLSSDSEFVPDQLPLDEYEIVHGETFGGGSCA